MRGDITGKTEAFIPCFAINCAEIIAKSPLQTFRDNGVWLMG
ncbi:Uncharacterised protein [Vibrio cholerae]|nr:Uncharacterised protein [Vibrio cholerae]CSI72422.1 Uncharacterised protein [Vibrio cholerae]